MNFRICLAFLAFASGLILHSGITHAQSVAATATEAPTQETDANADQETVASPDTTEKTATDVDDSELIKPLVVKLSVTKRTYTMNTPWRSNSSTSGGSGILIGPRRVLTNAHVVIYSQDIRVQRAGSSQKYDAKVIGIAHDLDLAVVEIEDESFESPSKFLPLANEMPLQQSKINVLGFPIGGETVSVTQGVVSRVEFAPIAYSSKGFRLQVDAALNPGNSGGPGIIDGQLAGVVTSGIKSADNIGYLISSIEINKFLSRLDTESLAADPLLDETGGIDLSNRKTLRLVTASMENLARRSYYNVDDNVHGRLVTHLRDTPDQYPLQQNDIILAVGGHEIDDDGNAMIEGRKIELAGVAELFANEGLVAVKVLRDGKQESLQVPLVEQPKQLVPELRGKRSPYFLYGPIAFSSASSDLIRGIIGMASGSDAGARKFGAAQLQLMAYFHHPMLFRATDLPEFDGEEIVLITRVLKHKSMRGNSGKSLFAVKSVNGEKVRNLRHLAEILNSIKSTHVKFDFHQDFSTPLIVNHKEMMRVTSDIMEDNSIRRIASPDLADVWQEAE